MTNTFIKRNLRAIISIAGGQDGNSVAATYTLDNHRMSVVMQENGEESMGEMNCRIYGVNLDLMNKLTAIGPVMNQIRNKNKIQIDAGNEGETLYTIFTGTIDTAYGDMNSAPDVALNIRAFSGMEHALTSPSPTSYSSPVNASQVMQDLATKMGLAFVNSGVDVMLPASYFENSLLEQVKACAKAANINYSIENDTMNIWPKDGYINEAAQVTGPFFGMIGYPTFSSVGMIVKNMFLPHARIGGRLTVQASEIRPANGTWGIYQVIHELESQTPDGKWFTTMGVQTKYA